MKAFSMLLVFIAVLTGSVDFQFPSGFDSNRDGAVFMQSLAAAEHCDGTKGCATNYSCNFPDRCFKKIPTFNGWTVWVGWAASFSESYAPESETYQWVAYFAPDGVYLTQQCAEAYYSGVDVNIGYNYFFGVAYSPQGATISRSYLTSLMGVSLSYNFLGMGLAPFGPLANLNVGASIGPTFFRKQGSDILERAVQLGAGFSVAYQLVPLPIPGTATLDCFTNVNIDFVKILNWAVNEDPNVNPMNKVRQGLQSVANETAGSGYFYDVQLNQMAQMMLTFFNTMQTAGTVTLPSSGNVGPAQYFAHFMQYTATPANPPVNSVDYLKKKTQEWLESGNTDTLSEALYRSIPLDFASFYRSLRGIDAGTRLGFETGYYLGTGADYVYAEDCRSENIIQCKPGELCSIVVTAEEIAALLPGTTAQSFEDKKVVFDNPTEQYLATMNTETSVTIKNGKATYSFVQASDFPLVIGARVDDPITGVTAVELCRRIVQFPESQRLLGQSSSIGPMLQLLLD
ncbi:MAG: hypothetical protein CVU57_22755 [Deltaproteobacteria bacterium HGW-Deltaproteobacteria-15]|jgi:hypothetical protein|nr:MAG: hypothetical protein CVU57_22755 [Deltaproteobacteria bacterium HGW-Deltaproteobacteria-15]